MNINWTLVGEYGTFVFYSLAFIFVAICIFKNSRYRRPGYIAFAPACFLIATEEISWGQRFIGIDTPEVLVRYNIQEKLNFHNIVEYYWDEIDLTGLSTHRNTKGEQLKRGITLFAFSVVLCLQPDIVLLDEVLAASDQSFQEKCIERLRTFQTNGGTMVVVSHNLGQVEKLCSRAVWMEDGKILPAGEVNSALKSYQESPIRYGIGNR